jgi:hypothetical protein
MARPKSRRAELANAARLYARLLYCGETRGLFTKTPRQVLRDFQLPQRWQALMPAPQSSGFLAEVHGRKVLAYQELQGIYATSLQHLTANEKGLHGPWLEAFLSSPEFFEPKWSLPHPTGVGRAHEGGTRFFFWARRHFDLPHDLTHSAFREDLYLDFVAYADNLAFSSSLQYFQRLRRGFCWQGRPPAAPFTLLTPERELHRFSDPAKFATILAGGALDLDTLLP